MNKTEIFGLLLIILAIVILAGYGLGYGLYVFVQAAEIPALIRIGVVALVIGFLIILLSLVRERLLDMQHEKLNK